MFLIFVKNLMFLKIRSFIFKNIRFFTKIKNIENIKNLNCNKTGIKNLFSFHGIVEISLNSFKFPPIYFP